MHRRHVLITALLLASSVGLPIMSVGCASHRYARVYDPYRSDYHRWSPSEEAYYHRWETQNHKDHREWAQRSRDEQREYWEWRHGDHRRH